MPLHIQQATITLLKQLAYTVFFAAIFAASDYVGNHDQFNLSQLVVAMILPVSLAIINTLEAFYQTKGDLAVISGIEQLKPRIQFLEQRLFMLQPAPAPLPSPAVGGPSPQAAASMPTQHVPSVSPIAPKFTAPSVQGGPLFVSPRGGEHADAPFSLAGPDMEARLSSFPFQQQQAGQS